MLGGIQLFAQAAVIARFPLDTAQPIAVHALVSPDTVYVGQQVTYEVGVFIDDQLRFRLRHNPEFIPPEPQGMLGYDLPSGAQGAVVRHIGGHLYDVHVFRRALFPLTPGRYEIPRAQLVYSLPLSLSFFSREEAHTLLAESLVVAVRAPPTAPGAAGAFTGAVGEVSLDASVDSVPARVGNPMLFTVRIAGRGNVPLFPRPAYAVPWATLIAAQERVRLDSTSAEVRGTKEFDWLVTPRESGRLTLPPVRYPYFNPYTERYEIAVAPAASLRVAPGALVPIDTLRADTAGALAIRATFRGTPARPLYATPVFLLLALGAPVVPVGAAAWRHRSRRRVRATISPALRLAALARRREPVDIMLLRRIYTHALADRFDLPAAALTGHGALALALAQHGATPNASRDAESVLALLDTRAYGQQASILRAAQGAEASGDLCARAYAAYAAVAAQGPNPGGGGGGAGGGGRGGRAAPGVSARGLMSVVGSAVILGGVTAYSGGEAAAGGADARAFGAGVAAYASRHYAAAARYFATAARLAPGAADAWADAGTAAWAVSDTADAVVGWQRAGRLEPFARDVRDRLALVRAPQDGSIARLPPVPPAWAANAALVLWLVTWGLAARRATRRGLAGVLSVGDGALTLGAAALGALAAWANTVAAARDLGVVGSGAALYEAPALAAQRIAELDAGDIARTLERRGVWAHVRLDGDRDGWIELTRLTPLAREP